MPKKGKHSKKVKQAIAPEINKEGLVVTYPINTAPAAAPAQVPGKASRFAAPGLQQFRCYLGHSSYALKEAQSVSCVACGAIAKPFHPQPDDLCLCGDRLHNHKPACLVCGQTDNGLGDGEYIDKCPAFVPMN